MRRRQRHAEAVEIEVFKHLYLSIAEEMGIALCRTSYSPNIKERRDYSCAVYDSQGETIAQGDHMPVHLGAMPLSVKAAIDNVPMQRGDMVMLNDPFQGGTHLPDITLVAPVFVDQRGRTTRPSFYVANRAHHSDVGGMSPGSMPIAREIYQEGLIIPPVLIMKGGKIQTDIRAMLLANVRTPVEREGDLAAQIAANCIGEERLRGVAARYGLDRALDCARRLQKYTAKAVSAAIRQIPAGTYAFDDVLDEDGVDERPVRIAVRITVRGGSAVLDFTGSDKQVRGSVNANFAITWSACLYAFRCLVTDDVLYNAGVGWPIRVIAPEGTVVNAMRPSPVAGGNVETSQRITDVVLGALGRALPDRLPAASQGTMNNVTIGGTNPATGRAFAYYETLGGGMGGRLGLDGLSGVHTHMSNTRNTPIEGIEHDLPIRIRQYRLRKGSGGSGASAGGDGLVREYELLSEAAVTVLSDRRRFPPYGVAGGSAGAQGANTLIRDGREEILPGKAALQLQPGDRLRIETPGGGGYGKR